MQLLQFYKYHGTGNDFIMIDDRENLFPVTDKLLIRKLCHRRFGIGADGIILISNHEEMDFEMMYFNADGSTSMCGNGARCAVQLAHDLHIIANQCTFMAPDGKHDALVFPGKIKLEMNNASAPEKVLSGFFIDTGTDHYVQLVENVADFPVVNKGRQLRYHERFFPAGTNVNFVEQIGKEKLKIRTYERGVEDETYSCGTGVTAASLVVAAEQNMSSPVTLETQGGMLEVEFEFSDNTFRHVYLSGPAEKVFEGTVFV
jgi:diaminopimelate epimerase